MTTTETTARSAMKLALEALEYISSHYMSLPKIGCMALAAVEEALAEQPAPVAKPHEQEPVAWLIWLHGPAGLFDHKQFAELEFERRNKEYPDPDRKLLPLYTSPPTLSLAQRLPDKLVYDGYETPQYIEGWNDCREFMKGMK